MLRLLLRADARARWRSWVVVAVLFGAIGGALTATVAAARRTETAYERFVQETNGFDLVFTNGGTTPTNLNDQFDYATVASLPQVSDSALVGYYDPAGRTDDGRPISTNDMSPFVSVRGSFGSDLNRAHVLDGRLPRGATEMAITLLVAQRLDLEVGSTLHLRLAGADALAGPPGDVPEEAFEVVGIVAMQTGFPPATGGLPPPVLLTDAYLRSHPYPGEVIAVRLRHGQRDAAAFERELRSLAGGDPIVMGSADEFSGIERALSAQATAMRAAAVLLGVGALLMLGQLAWRLGTTEMPALILRGVGITSGELRTLAAIVGALAGLAAGVLTAIVAVALSPSAPVGVARQAELHPGIEVNMSHISVGTVAVAATVVCLSVAGGWTSGRVRRTDLARRPSALGGAIARTGIPIAGGAGVRMALEPGRGPAAVPVRSTVLTNGLAIAMIGGVLVFSSNLRAVFEDPVDYGWNWDLQVGDSFAPPLDGEADRLQLLPEVEALAQGTTVRVDVEGTAVDALATESTKGLVEPTVISGRAPAGDGEILLGTRTLRDIGKRIGDDVTVRSGDMELSMVVVGRGVMPAFAGASGLGDGAALTFGGLRALVPDAVVNVLLVRTSDDDRGDAVLADLVRREPGHLYLPERPRDLLELERLDGLPLLLSGILAIMSGATLVHTLASSVRRRRRDLGILKALGLPRRQMSAVVAYQAAALVVVAIILGVPAGWVLGDLAWRTFADRLGVPPHTEVPWLALSAVAALALAVGIVAAVLPARRAALTHAAAALRSE